MSRCVSCDEERPNGECSQSHLPCAHHCNHSWSHDYCCWCGESMLDAASSVSAGAGRLKAQASGWGHDPHCRSRELEPTPCDCGLADFRSSLAGAGQVPAGTIEKAREALERYGHHEYDCARTPRRYGVTYKADTPCTCGYTAALAAVRTPEEQT